MVVDLPSTPLPPAPDPTLGGGTEEREDDVNGWG